LIIDRFVVLAIQRLGGSEQKKGERKMANAKISATSHFSCYCKKLRVFFTHGAKNLDRVEILIFLTFNKFRN
jgi:hypothetical protein